MRKLSPRMVDVLCKLLLDSPQTVLTQHLRSLGVSGLPETTVFAPVDRGLVGVKYIQPADPMKPGWFDAYILPKGIEALGPTYALKNARRHELIALSARSVPGLSGSKRAELNELREFVRAYLHYAAPTPTVPEL